MPTKLTGISAILKSFAIGASCAVAINPPAPTRTNITYITQNTGVLSTSIGRNCRRVCRTLEDCGTWPSLGAASSRDSTTTMMP